MSFDLHDILGPGGAVARRLGDSYESRSQQLEMARAVEAALNKGGKLLVEAGTGVGKSFAYLLPAVGQMLRTREQGAEDRKGRGRVVIATHTIALQEQLIEKDIPLIRAVVPDEFSAVLVKGRGNYLSLRRLKRTLERDRDLLTEPAETRTLEMIEAWADSTADGSLASLPILERPTVWDNVRSDADDCMGRRCPTFRQCFYQSARRRMEHADILVVNHALFFADLALRSGGAGFLPPYEHVILDEAHMIEQVAAEHFGLGVSRFQVRFLLGSLVRSRGKGLLPSLQRKMDVKAVGLDRAIQAVDKTLVAGDQFFDSLIHWQEQFGRSNGRVSSPDIVDNTLSPVLEELAASLKMVRDRTEDDDDRLELDAYANRATALAGSVKALVEQTLEDYVYWLEIDTKKRLPRVKWRCAPVEVGPLLREHLFEQVTAEAQPISVVLTSATLAAGSAKPPGPVELRAQRDQADPFGHLRQRLCADDAQGLVLGSPFDYARQVRLVVEPSLPEPTDSAFFSKLCPRVLAHIDRSDGGAFVLFTSYDLLRKTAHWLEPFLRARQMPMLVHGQGEQRSALLARFRQDPRSVLLGADSFWQGVDVRGQGLRNVIVTRLPFSPPDDPLVEARIERIKARGGNAFAEYSLPEAILKFKQGFGRLIRSREDVGTVVVMDSRIVGRSYGRQFLAALPDVPIERM